MTLLTDATVTSALTAAGTEDNPFVAHANLASDATISVTSGTQVTSVANLVSGATYNFCKVTPSGSGVVEIQFVFSSAVELDFAAIAAHNLGDIGANFRVQYSTNSGANWTVTGAGNTTPTDNDAIGLRFAATTADYWRIRITGAGSTDVVIGVAMLSNALIVPTRTYQGYTPAIQPMHVDLQSNVSEGGHLLGSSVVRRASSAQVQLRNLSPSFVRSDDWTSFVADFNGGNGFFWAWRPDKYADDFHYAWRSGGALSATNSGPNDLMSANMQMRLFDEP